MSIYSARRLRFLHLVVETEVAGVQFLGKVAGVVTARHRGGYLQVVRRGDDEGIGTAEVAEYIDGCGDAEMRSALSVPDSISSTSARTRPATLARIIKSTGTTLAAARKALIMRPR